MRKMIVTMMTLALTTGAQAQRDTKINTFPL